MPSYRAPPPASVGALARARQKQAVLESEGRSGRAAASGAPATTNAGTTRDGLLRSIHDEDDPDHLYFSRGLGRLDSDDDSDDDQASQNGALSPFEEGEYDEEEEDDNNNYEPAEPEDEDDDGQPGRPIAHSASFRKPPTSYDLSSRRPSESAVDSQSDDDVEAEISPEEQSRFEWQHMLGNVLQGDVLRSEKTRISTASLSTSALASAFGFIAGGNGSRRQRAYAIWLLLRAQVRGKTADEEARYIEDARTKVDGILDEVIKFRVRDLTPREGDPPIDEGSKYQNAADQVAALLKRVDWCESLYPSTKALALEKSRYTDPQLVGRLEALRSWQAICERLDVTIGILKKWVGDDWEVLSTVPDSKDRRTSIAFVDNIVREDALQVTFEKRLLLDLNAIVNTAKAAMIDLSSFFEEMNLPGFTSALLRLAVFPSRLVQEALRTKVDSVTNINEPSVALIDQLTGDIRRALSTACDIKRQYLEIAEPDLGAGWNLPEHVSEYEDTLVQTLRFFFKLLHWKLKSPSKAIYFKETEIVESEWSFLCGVIDQIEGGDLLVGEHFCTLTHRLLLRVMSYFETQLQVLETRDMSMQDMLRWFSQTLDNVRARHRKLLRFGKTMLQRFENSAEYSLDNINLPLLINGLIETDHFIIYTGSFEREGTYLIGDPTLHERPHLVRDILVKCFSAATQFDAKESESEDYMHYLLVLTPREPFMWTGRVMNLEFDDIELDVREKRVRIISDGPGTRLARSKQMFLDLFPAFRRNVLVESRAHLPRISREIKKIGRSVFRLAAAILGAVHRVRDVSRRTQDEGHELLGNYFSFAADLGQRSVKYLNSHMRKRYVTMLMRFAIEWIAFICDDCVPTDPRTFKWAVPALEFAMSITRGDNILKYSSDEFTLLRTKVAACMTLLISHFDILGARSSTAAKNTKMINSTAGTAGANDSGGESRDGSSHDDLQKTWERRMAALKALEEERGDANTGGRAVGRVLDQEKLEDRSLAFLASAASNIQMRWQQGKFIGGGTFGSVYLAVNLDSGEEVAVKEIRFQDLASAPHLIKTVRDEMKVMEMLRHPNIVEYYGIEVHRDKVYIFEEYCAGGSLASLLEHGRIEEELILQMYAMQLLDGLIYLHAQNIVHRDIKPDNILLDANGTIKYVDFGAAKVLAKNQRTLKTLGKATKPGPLLTAGADGAVAAAAPEANSLTGTPMYLSPETVKGERRGRMGAMDVWAMGCVILECATGRRPWSNLDNEWAIMFHIGIAVQHPPLPESGQLSELGIDFIRQCLTIDPMARPTAAELMSHPWIESFQREMQTSYDEESVVAPPRVVQRQTSLSSIGIASSQAVLEEDDEELDEDAQDDSLESSGASTPMPQPAGLNNFAQEYGKRNAESQASLEQVAEEEEGE